MQDRSSSYIFGVHRNFDSWLLTLDSPIALILHAPHKKLQNGILGVRKIGVYSSNCQ